MIDASKLSPAPWFVGITDEKLIIRCEKEECDVATIVWEDREHQHWQPHDAAFIVIARNAFDVMMRRGWSVVPLDRGKAGLWWVVRVRGGFDMPLEFVVANQHGEFSDPFTALVEADAWMKQREAKP